MGRYHRGRRADGDDLFRIGVVGGFVMAEVGVDGKAMGYYPCQEGVQDVFPGMTCTGLCHCCFDTLIS